MIGLINGPPLGAQVGIIEDIPSTQTFQMFKKTEGSAVTLSPTGWAIIPISAQASPW